MDDKKKEYLKSGNEVTGATIGGFIGALGGPVGSIIGGAAGVLISKTLNELMERFLSHNEQSRVISSAEHSINIIKKRIDAGDKIREDDFFDTTNNRSKAEEIFEGTLIKSKNQYQEKKIPYISNIFANSVFSEKIKSEDINQILDTTEKFTYRKICVIKFCKDNIDIGFSSIRDSDYRDNYDLDQSFELPLLLQDFMDLYNLGIISRSDGTTMLDISDVHPKIMSLTSIGQIYFELLGAQDIPPDDYQKIIHQLSDTR